VLDEARTYGTQEIISDMPEALGTKRSLTGGIVAESSKKTKLDGNDNDSPFCDNESSWISDSGVTSVEPEMNTTELDSSLANEVGDKSKQTSKYINRDIASEALKAYQMDVLAGKKLIYKGGFSSLEYEYEV